ncbi:type III effector HrpK domain-containing protein [Vibrio porteresiae]|uniref:Type III effector HrpK domain-containing protein n=1 Tax=Vibrio porteresiae DSM 19223 TaxID=1123496 RepID=A0ABZ0QFZ3_9VIBR|nr:type III effector HrpK domain-containing protein [Vibrio porteresiae]WPC75398.1 type III effector HrpK domain-containing protein [Vibrio porteresiae DSM 19223]
MRIDSNVVASSGLNDAPLTQTPPVIGASRAAVKGDGIQFGASTTRHLDEPNPSEKMDWLGQSPALFSLFKKRESKLQESSQNCDALLQSSARCNVASMPLAGITAASPVSSNVATEKLNSISSTDPAVLAAIDNSQFSRADELKRWGSMVGHLPESERVAAEKVLNRPYAAAKLALEGTDEQKAKALEYINANQALFTAIETRAGAGDNRHVMADGSLSDKDLKVFAGTMKERANQASEMVTDYQQKHPDADEQSLSLVRSSALLYANDPLTRSASALKQPGVKDQQDTKYANIDDLKTLSDSNNNPDLSPLLTDAARLWSKPGMFNTLEDMGLNGKDVARHGGDGLLDLTDYSAFIDKVAPTNSAEFNDFISYVSMANAADKVDTSKLNQDIFEQPNQYSGAEKAAVLVTLQRTLQYVIAGESIRNTEQTEKELNEKIEQLQNDKDAQRYLEQQSKISKKEIINSSADLSRSVNHHLKTQVLTGDGLREALRNEQGQAADVTQATAALENFHDDVQLYQDITGKQLGVADIVAFYPDLAESLRGTATSISDGTLLTQLATQKETSPEQALNSYWNSLAYMDDALSKTAQGGIGIPQTAVIQQALQNAGVNSQMQGAINDTTLKALLNGKTNMTPIGIQGAEHHNGNAALDRLKEMAIKKGAKFVAKQGAKFAVRMAASLAGRAAAAVAGEAAGAALAGSISSVAGPVGWAVGAAVSIGFGISELVSFFKNKAKKRRERRDFDHTVSPTLNQFGISKPR